jgi:hypothetical protein
MIEIIIATAILVIVVTSIYGLLAGSSRFYSASVSLEHIQEQARRVVDELAQEMRLADQATLAITTVNGSNQVVFRRITGFVGGVPQWGTNVTWNCQSSAVDANGNGVVDEGRVVRTFNGVSITKCHNVVTGGLTFTRTGDNILIRLTLIGIDSQRKLIQTFAETSVTLRNSST